MLNLLDYRPERDASRAEWAEDRIRPFNERSLTTVVPEGFESYARIFQSAWKWPGIDPSDHEKWLKLRAGHWPWADATPISWTDVAKESGAIAHRLMHWYYVSPGQYVPGTAGISAPIEYEITSEIVEALFEILVRRSGEDMECICAFWEGYGTLDALRRAGNTRTEGIGQQSYFLFNAPLGSVRDQWARVMEGRSESVGLAPNAIWPVDHGWYYAVPIGPMTSYFGGNNSLVQEIVDSPCLEAYPIYPQDNIWEDLINQARSR